MAFWLFIDSIKSQIWYLDNFQPINCRQSNYDFHWIENVFKKLIVYKSGGKNNKDVIFEWSRMVLLATVANEKREVDYDSVSRLHFHAWIDGILVRVGWKHNKLVDLGIISRISLAKNDINCFGREICINSSEIHSKCICNVWLVLVRGSIPFRWGKHRENVIWTFPLNASPPLNVLTHKCNEIINTLSSSPIFDTEMNMALKNHQFQNIPRNILLKISEIYLKQ